MDGKVKIKKAADKINRLRIHSIKFNRPVPVRIGLSPQFFCN